VTSLDVRNKNISDLTGIEGFNTLTTLYCFGNQLTSLDVSNNTALTDLRCFGNQLTSLDVSGANALEILRCSSNQLTSLDVSNNNALTILGCGNNQLTSLGVSNNTALTSLSCDDNQFTSLDLSGATALNILFCENSQLTSLDVRNGNNEAFFKFFAGENPNLTCIYVDDADYSNANWPNIDPNSTFVNNEAECEALSIGENALELDVFVYPNPTDNYLFVEGNKNPISISIYNLLGAEVIAKSATDKINVSELSKGVYIIRISDGVNQANKRFIKN
jgi:Leucine-rich repeat (LRR) protein